MFSPDGRHLAWVGGQAKEEYVIVDGRRGASYARIAWIRFSEDGNHLCYLATKPERDRTLSYRVVVDGFETPPRKHVKTPCDQPLKRLRYLTLAPDMHYRLMEIDWPKAFDWTNGLGPAKP